VNLNEILRSEKQDNSIGAFPFASAPLRQNKTEKFSLHFLIFSRPIFSFKRKRKFFCFVFLLIKEKRKRSILNRKMAKACPERSRTDSFPQTPFLFALLLFGLRPIFLRGFYFYHF